MKKYPCMEKLRAEMWATEFSHRDLAAAIERSDGYVSARMTGKLPWDLDDVYRICSLLDIPYDEIPTYFPPRKAIAANLKQ